MNVLDQATGDGYTIFHGDCVEVVAGLPDRSMDYAIFSPPFASLYTYSNSPRSGHSWRGIGHCLCRRVLHCRNRGDDA